MALLRGSTAFPLGIPSGACWPQERERDYVDFDSRREVKKKKVDTPIKVYCLKNGA